MNATGARSNWTYSEYARLPDDGHRYEVIDGEVCMTPAPGPPHQRVAAKLFQILAQYIDDNRLGEMLWDVDLLFVSGQFLRPDMLFVPVEAAAGVTDRGMEEAPGLVVEVLSPHSKSIDRIRKPPRYRDFGVHEYWVVDPEGRAIERYRLSADAAPEICQGMMTWQPHASMTALQFDVQLLFPPKA